MKYCYLNLPGYEMLLPESDQTSAQPAPQPAPPPLYLYINKAGTVEVGHCKDNSELCQSSVSHIVRNGHRSIPSPTGIHRD